MRSGSPIRFTWCGGNRCVDKVRHRVQQQILGHRGRKHDPLYRIRKLLLTGNESLDDRGRERMLLGLRVGDLEEEVLRARLAKESVRDIYLADTWRQARLLLDKTVAGCLADDVPEIASLGNTLKSWRTENLAHHTTGASNGPTEGLNLCVETPRRRRHLVNATSATPDQNSRSPLIRVEPVKATLSTTSAPLQTQFGDCRSGQPWWADGRRTGEPRLLSLHERGGVRQVKGRGRASIAGVGARRTASR
jgi:Transposase